MTGKKMISIILAGAVLTAFSSCGDGKNSSDSAATELSVYEKYAEVPVDYKKKNAEFEDSSLNLWFDHSFSKIVQSNTVSSDRNTYKMYTAKNEKEDCQFFLSSREEKTVKLEITDFTDNGGAVVPTFLYYEYYFSMPYGGEEQMVPDAIPECGKGQIFTVAANTSTGFIIQAQTSVDTPAGDYTATLTISDSADRKIKIADVFLHVWDFILSENTSCRTAMWIDKNNLQGMDYKTVYDYLLDNRVNAYDLPYGLSDDNINTYLDNPRVNSFNVLGFKYNRESGKTEAQIKTAISAAYKKLSAKSSWNSKGYFYLVDEPNPSELQKLEWIKMYGEWLSELYPGYRQLSPFYTDQWYDDEKSEDWIEYLRPYINIWAPKTYAYTTLREYGQIVNGKCLYKEGQEGEIDSKFGNYPARIRKMTENDGAEAWWYVTSQPGEPYITFNTNESGTAYRVLFWQQKMNGVKGLLYWSVNYWSGDGWNSCENEWTPGSKTYGNGQLIYPGAKVGKNSPVGSLRLECIRDGIEDYQMLTMLDKYIGADKTKELINRTTTNVAVWNGSDDNFASERIIAGNYLEALSKAK